MRIGRASGQSVSTTLFFSSARPLPGNQQLARASPSGLLISGNVELDASFFDDPSLEAVLTDNEKDSILADVKTKVLGRINYHVIRLKKEWRHDYPPEDHFDDFTNAIKVFVNALGKRTNSDFVLRSTRKKISSAVSEMSEDYEASSSTSAPIASSTPRSTPLTNLFRDVDE